MKRMMVAALAAAQLSVVAAPARAADLPREEAALPRAGLDGDARADLDRAQEEVPRAEAGREDRPRKKHKSTGDKLLTGAAVVLGVGALAVGGLLVAIFVS